MDNETFLHEVAQLLKYEDYDLRTNKKTGDEKTLTGVNVNDHGYGFVVKRQGDDTVLIILDSHKEREPRVVLTPGEAVSTILRVHAE